MSGDNLPITVEFGGGAELLFNNKKKHEVKLNSLKTTTIRDLLSWMKTNLIGERPELFFQGESVRPGILVLVNETDWELMGQLDYQLQSEDRVLFISTLHGG